MGRRKKNAKERDYKKIDYRNYEEADIIIPPRKQNRKIPDVLDKLEGDYAYHTQYGVVRKARKAEDD